MSFQVPSFINRWPSLLKETVSGIILVGLSLAALRLAGAHPTWAIFALATGGSVLYERRLDASGWNWSDIGQREFGILVAVLILRLAHLV